MKKNLCIVWCMFFLLGCDTIHSVWFAVDIDNDTDLTFVKAARNHDVEIPSISKIFTTTINQHSILLSIDQLFGSLNGCKIIGQNKQGQAVSFVFFGDPMHRVANGRAQRADLASRKIAGTLKNSMLARIFMDAPDGSSMLIGYVGYDNNNQPIKLTFHGSAGSYQVDCTLVK